MKKRLRDIADIQAGHQFRGRVAADPAGNVPVIQMKDIDDDRRVNVSELVRIHLDQAPQACTAAAGDVLFLARGNRLTASFVPSDAAGSLVAGLFFILRPDTNVVDPRYLAWVVNQPSFQAQLRSFVRGTDIAIVAKADFQEMWVHVPPLKTQQGIVALDELFLKERKLCTALAEKRAQLLHALSLKAAGAKK